MAERPWRLFSIGRSPCQSWRENGISYERVVQRVAPEVRAGCPALWDYLAHRLELARRDGWFGA